MNLKKKNKKNFKVKNIIKKLNVEPLKKTTIKFLNWFSEYNIIPKGMALKLVLLSSNAVEKLSKDTYKNFNFNIKSNSIKLSEEQKKSLKIPAPISSLTTNNFIEPIVNKLKTNIAFMLFKESTIK